MTADPPNGRAPQDAPPPGDFDARLKRAQSRAKPEVTEAAYPSQMGLAFRLVAEFLAWIGVGILVGVFLDRVLGTFPWLMLALLLLGSGAGLFRMIYSMMRIEKSTQAAAAESKLPSSPDDDDTES